MCILTGKKEIMRATETANGEGLDLQLTAALGTKWSHAVNIRLVLESLSGTSLRVALSLHEVMTLK